MGPTGTLGFVDKPFPSSGVQRQSFAKSTRQEDGRLDFGNGENSVDMEVDTACADDGISTRCVQYCDFDPLQGLLRLAGLKNRNPSVSCELQAVCLTTQYTHDKMLV